MEHDHNAGTGAEGFGVACFLVPAVTQIARVDESFDAQSMGLLHCSIGAVIVDEQNFIHNIHRYFPARAFERARGFVRGKDDDDEVIEKHDYYIVTKSSFA